MSWVTVAVGVGGAVVNGVSAANANKANEAALASEEARVGELAAQLDAGGENLNRLIEERDVPSELFAQLVRQFPGLLEAILPQLTNQAIGTSDRLADSGSDQFLRLRDKLVPGASQLQSDQLAQINRLNPDNLAQEDMLALTRKLSPLIPAGTLDPNSGAVQGATTNPVSLYRNLISSQFNERRSQFLGEARSFVGDANNAASRQQVSAADFLNSNLDRAFNSSAQMAAADVAQQQGDINTQLALLQLSAQGLQPQYDPTANNQLIAAGTKGAISSLGVAANALAAKN